MPIFSYKARDEAGHAVQGKMETVSARAVAEKLRDLRYTVVSVAEINPVFSLRLELPSLFHIRDEDYVAYTAQLSSMLSAGIPLSVALDTMVEQTENQKLRTATTAVVQDVRGGISFSDALHKHPAIFPNLFVNMVAAGEAAGNLEEVLTRLSSYMEKNADFKQKVITALFYPIVLVIFAVVVVIFIILTVLPTFVKLFKESRVPLPLPTQVLYNVNLFVRGYWQLLISLVFMLILGFNALARTRVGKAALDRISLDLPLWGPLNRKINIAQFSRSLASLLSAGVPILSSLKTIALTTDNVVFKNVFNQAEQEVSKGGTLAEPLRTSGEFPAMPVKMIAVGEEAGKLDQMLTKIAEFYELSVDYTVRRLTSILEPVLLVIVGSMVGFIFASVLLPIFQMVKVLQQ